MDHENSDHNLCEDEEEEKRRRTTTMSRTCSAIVCGFHEAFLRSLTNALGARGQRFGGSTIEGQG